MSFFRDRFPSHRVHFETVQSGIKEHPRTEFVQILLHFNLHLPQRVCVETVQSGIKEYPRTEFVQVVFTLSQLGPVLAWPLRLCATTMLSGGIGLPP